MNSITKIIVLGLGVLFSFSVNAQYAVSKISPELKEGAKVVVRDYDFDFKIESESKAVLTVKKVITILSKEGSDEAALYLNYDDNRKVTSLSAQLYNSAGFPTKKFKQNEFKDYSAVGGGTLYSDSRVIYAKPIGSYPFTIEYNYTIESSELIFYPTWVPIDDEQVALEKGKFIIRTPKGHSFRHKAINLENPDPVKESEKNEDIYTWTLKNKSPIRVELYSNGYEEALPLVYTAPDKFSYAGYEGNFNTWDDYAQWYNSVNTNRDQLSPENQEMIKQMIRGEEDEVEIVRKIYEYLQDNTRYVSIQLGIGGFQSFPADITAENGYGDCKALTTYTKGMLEVAGIDSYYVLVRAGRTTVPIQSDFPSQQFNHVFLAVPVEKDTLWLECTSQTTPFGYIGTFTGNREVLIVNDEGGYIVRTPTYDEKVNLQLRKAVVTIDENGNGNAQITTTYKGTQYENHGLNWYIRKSSDEQKKWLYNKIDIPSFEINEFSFSEERLMIPSITEDLDLEMRNYANISGKRLFLQPNLMNRYSSMPPSDEDRKSDILLETAWTDIDSITYILPEGYYVENGMNEKIVNSPFGNYEIRVIQDSPSELTYIRKMTKFRGSFPAEKYKEFQKFMRDVIRTDKRKIVLVKGT